MSVIPPNELNFMDDLYKNFSGLKELDDGHIVILLGIFLFLFRNVFELLLIS